MEGLHLNGQITPHKMLYRKFQIKKFKLYIKTITMALGLLVFLAFL